MIRKLILGLSWLSFTVATLILLTLGMSDTIFQEMAVLTLVLTFLLAAVFLQLVAVNMKEAK